MNATTRHWIHEFRLIYEAMDAVFADVDADLTEEQLLQLTMKKLKGACNPSMVRKCIQNVHETPGQED